MSGRPARAGRRSRVELTHLAATGEPLISSNPKREEVRLWSTADGRLLRELKLQDVRWRGGRLLGLATQAADPATVVLRMWTSDGQPRLWRQPAGLPLHTRPYAELLGTLKTLTNLRVVPDPGASTGYRFEIGPFPGWKEVPEW